jgi:hypothetical protein
MLTVMHWVMTSLAPLVNTEDTKWGIIVTRHKCYWIYTKNKYILQYGTQYLCNKKRFSVIRFSLSHNTRKYWKQIGVNGSKKENTKQPKKLKYWIHSEKRLWVMCIHILFHLHNHKKGRIKIMWCKKQSAWSVQAISILLFTCWSHIMNLFLQHHVHEAKELASSAMSMD